MKITVILMAFVIMFFLGCSLSNNGNSENKSSMGIGSPGQLASESSIQNYDDISGAVLAEAVVSE